MAALFKIYFSRLLILQRRQWNFSGTGVSFGGNRNQFIQGKVMKSENQAQGKAAKLEILVQHSSHEEAFFNFNARILHMLLNTNMYFATCILYTIQINGIKIIIASLTTKIKYCYIPYILNISNY